MTTVTPIKVAIADDHLVVIEGLQKALATIDDIVITDCYQRGHALLHDISSNMPDVLLLDVQLPDIRGKELAMKLLKQYPNLKILVLSGVEAHSYIQDMIEAGCLGYLLKGTADRDMLHKGIHEVYRGNLYIDPSIREELFREMLAGKRKKQQMTEKITEREKEVLEFILKEMDNQEIADELNISIRTVENHRYNLSQKLNVKNIVGLVKAAMDMGLGTPKGSGQE